MNMPAPIIRDKPRKTALGVFSFCVSIFGVVVHFWAGWEDEHRIVFRPVGPLTVIVAAVWLFTILISLAALIIDRRQIWAFVSLALAITGFLLLLSR